MSKLLPGYLKYLATPGFVPEYMAIAVSYLTILIIFPIDVFTGSHITLNVIYVLPLTIVALHCRSNGPVAGALFLSIIVQGMTLHSFVDDSRTARVVVFVIVLVSDVIVVLISRYARNNILEAERLSTTDPLTRLGNRRALHIALEAETTRQRRYGGTFSLVLIDLDGFKSVNDTLGHAEGDKALVLMADILRANTRKSDLVFRIGGDEFVVLMPNTEATDAGHLCDGFCSTVAERMRLATYPVTASIGFTTVDKTPAPTIDLLTIADRAMYAAKTGGKSRVVRG